MYPVSGKADDYPEEQGIGSRIQLTKNDHSYQRFRIN